MSIFATPKSEKTLYAQKHIYVNRTTCYFSSFGVDFLPEKNPFSARCHFLDQGHKIDRLKGRSELESGGEYHEIPQAKKNSSQNSRLLQKAALWLILCFVQPNQEPGFQSSSVTQSVSGDQTKHC